MPRAFYGGEPATGRDDEAWLVFATNANVLRGKREGEGEGGVM